MVAALVFQPKASTTTAGAGGATGERRALPGSKGVAHTASALVTAAARAQAGHSRVKGNVAGAVAAGDGNSTSGSGRQFHGGAGIMGRKNVRAMETLFNIAHCLGGTLGSSWATVLDTFQRFDAILAMALQGFPGIAPSSHPQSGALLHLLRFISPRSFYFPQYSLLPARNAYHFFLT